MPFINKTLKINKIYFNIGVLNVQRCKNLKYNFIIDFYGNSIEIISSMTPNTLNKRYRHPDINSR